ncbi:sensory transduction histidine kinase, putative [Bacillus pumilus ATCC 7061]|nr:sensory transduction histidine kinase, putative [Bacillus pumilus ATCC 7061]
MYASKGVVIHFAVDTNVVITVYKEKDNAGSIAKRLLIDAYEVIKKNATETISQYESFSAELDEELRWLAEELQRTRSKAKRMALQARINAVQMRVDELPTESLEIKRQVTRYARGVAAYV